MQQTRVFQVVLLVLFGALFLGSVLFFAVYRPSSDNPEFTERIEIWGTVSGGSVQTALEAVRAQDKRFEKVVYNQISEDVFVDVYTNALAENRGPDLVIIPHTLITTLRSKLFVIPYENYPRDMLRDVTEGSSIFAFADGMYALPFAVDPLVMYWNRNLFSDAGLPLPPVTWEELRNTTVPTLTRTNSTFDVLQSAVAFGEYDNVTNAGAIVSLLFLQSGSNIVEQQEGVLNVVLENAQPLSFYTEFANPQSALYSWNRAQPNDRSQFLAEDLALYFDFFSAYNTIARANPNLNFDITPVPQGATASIKRGYGIFYGIALSWASTNASDAFLVARVLSDEAYAPIIAAELGFAPIHLRTLQAGTIDPIQVVGYDAALTARGWITPEPTLTGRLYERMINNVTSGRMEAKDAMNDFSVRLGDELRQ